MMRFLLVIGALWLASCMRQQPGAGGAESAESPKSGESLTVVRAPLASDPPEAAKPARSFHDFVPSRHGFHFRNGFQGTIMGTGESAYGLCGGMSFAAADYFLAGRPVPGDIETPRDGSPLFRYIYARQATSFGTLGAMGLKYLEWMQLPDRGENSAYSRTLEELPYITKALVRGEPIVLGQVLTSTASKGKAWDNHQVLAFSAAPARQSPELPVTIRIYDSNFPNRDDITIVIGDEGIRQVIPGRRDIAIRGLFRMAYTPAEPPAD